MILVTGGTGLVGSHLIYNLITSNCKVRAIIRKNSNYKLTEKIFSYYSNNSNELINSIEWIEADITDINSLHKCFDGVTHVYHCAAVVSFNPSDKENISLVNILGTKNIAELCLKYNISKLCYVSSIAALGREKNNGYITEETEIKNFKNISLYSLSKHQAEKEVWKYIDKGLKTVIVNPSIIIGPGDWNKGSSQIFSEVAKGLAFYTLGSNGYVDVRDVASIMILLMNSNVENQRFIVSTSNCTYKEIVCNIAEALGKKKPVFKAGYLLSEIYWRIAFIISLITGNKPLITKETAKTSQKLYKYSNQKFYNLFNYKPYTIKESIEHTAKLYTKDNM